MHRPRPLLLRTTKQVVTILLVVVMVDGGNDFQQDVVTFHLVEENVETGSGRQRVALAKDVTLKFNVKTTLLAPG
uniref:Uncharacterized protein n=1 Tax=Vespula pensylvanica TaxID=30213 RepID=A0A834UDP7_VESPE|nr:hypothetical protein H0235_005272 [Vespula pensylvanica]